MSIVASTLARRCCCALAAMVLGGALAAPAAAHPPRHDRYANTDCRLQFSLSGWSAIYKTSHGRGMITCDNGQRMRVALESHGGGLTVGRSRISGHGRFSPVPNIDALMGSYAAGGAHIGIGNSAHAGARVLTNGRASLALSGEGSGIDIGVDISGFTISPLR